MNNLDWAPVENYEGCYEINKAGQVRSLFKGNFQNVLPQRTTRRGYYIVNLCRNNKTTTASIHRLLAIAFIPNPDRKSFVNHKDGNKLNNELGNLEWCTHAENIKHAYDLGLIKKKKANALAVIDTCSNELYKSVSEAARAMGIPYSTCKNYLNGNRPNQTCLKYAA